MTDRDGDPDVDSDVVADVLVVTERVGELEGVPDGSTSKNLRPVAGGAMNVCVYSGRHD